MTADKKSALIVACDSQVLIWALPWAMRPDKKKKRGQQDVPEMRRRAKLLLRMFEDQRAEMYIPSVVVSELLAGVDPKKHTRVIADFQDHFFCPPFDLKACVLAAKLWHFERGLPGHSAGLPEEERSARRVLKSDILIVASAKEAGVSDFYSHEPKCRRLAAEAKMVAHDLPVTSGNWATDLEVKEEVEREQDM